MELIKYDEAKRAIAAYQTVDEVKDFRDKALAIEAYAKQANDHELEQNAAKARVRAERRAGELLKELEKNTGAKGVGKSVVDEADRTPTLSEMGITKDQSSTWQKAANIPEKEFEKAIDETIEKRGSLTTRNIVKKDVVAFTGEYEWYTPREYIALARTVLGGINLDPASCEKANETVQADNYYTVQQDGIAQPWFGTVWLNPPYCHPKIAQFTNKLIDDYRSGNVTAAILLTNNSTDTKWFQSSIEQSRAVCFPSARIQFQNGRNSSQPLRGQAFFYFGPRVEEFKKSFCKVGKIMTTLS